MKYGDNVETRKKEKAEQRFFYCAGMLAIHGFVTDAERRKIHKRMMKWKLSKK